MIIARPMGIVRTILFIFLFMISRLPILFLIVASILYGMVTLPQLITLAIIIFIAKSYIESEITGASLKYFVIFRFIRLILPILFFIIISTTLIYYLIASPFDRLLIISAMLLMVILFYDFKVMSGYFYGYRVGIGAKIVTTLLWAFMLFVPDSALGKLSILIAIYLIEFYNLYTKDRLNNYINTM